MRHITIMIIPEEYAQVKTWRISYRALKISGVLLGLLLAVLFIFALNYGKVAATAIKVAQLTRENQKLRHVARKITRLEHTLATHETLASQIKEMLGVETSEKPGRFTNFSTLTVPSEKPFNASGISTSEWETHLTNKKFDPTLLEKIRHLKGKPSEYPLTKSGYISEKFDRFPNGDFRHRGIDIAVPENTPVLAAADGVVLAVGFSNFYGNYVLIHHADDYKTLYGHNSKVLIKEGQIVKRKDIIALSGSTGHSTGAHLHYEVLKSGIQIDPEPFIPHSYIIAKPEKNQQP